MLKNKKFHGPDAAPAIPILAVGFNWPVILGGFVLTLLTKKHNTTFATT